jgi:tartrate dehydrogenase/decarboxylase/D-malate dehydrogenase
MIRTYALSCIPGDGIGPEVVDVARSVLESVGHLDGFSVQWRDFPWGSDFYRANGLMMPLGAIDQMCETDAIFFGAVGSPDIPDDITLWGLLIPIRRAFDQYVNLRPVRYAPGTQSPLRKPEEIDLLIVRENSEGEYSEIGGRFGQGTDREFATQEAVFTRHGISRITKYAAELAERRSGRLTSVTKSNGIIHSMKFWDEVVAEEAEKIPNVTLRSVLVDAMAAELVLRPERHDVIVCSNLFGDILSDLASACVGSLGLAASGNINPERKFPSMFESVHGSAPDIVGRGIANPLAQVGSAAMMLDHLGEHTSAQRINEAIDRVLAAGVLTPDLGGTANTGDVQSALLQSLS